jgi:hypothetical protein
MRFLLAGILALLPLNTQAASSDCMNIAEPGSCAEADLSNAELQVDPHSLADDVSFSGNAYSPASPTNFEPFIGPYLSIQGQRSIILYDPRSPNTTTAKDSGQHSFGVPGWHQDRYGRNNLNKVF